MQQKFGGKIKIFDVSKILILQPFKIWISRQKLNLAVIFTNWSTAYFLLLRWMISAAFRGFEMPRRPFGFGEYTARGHFAIQTEAIGFELPRLVQSWFDPVFAFSGAVFVEFPHGCHHVNYCACRTRNNTCMSAFRKTFI